MITLQGSRAVNTWDLQQQALVKMADETECDFGKTKSNKGNKGKQSKMEMNQETASIAHDHHDRSSQNELSDKSNRN